MDSFEKMFCLLLLDLIGVCACQGPADVLAEFVLNFDSQLYVCPDPSSVSFIDTSAVDVERYNETTSYMSGAIEFLKGIDYDIMVEVIVNRKINGQYEMISSHEICDMCSKDFGKDENLYSKYFSYFGFPTECPFAPGPYQFPTMTADSNDVPINIATAGGYQVNLNLYKNPDGSCKNEKYFLACLKIDFIIEQL